MIIYWKQIPGYGILYKSKVISMNMRNKDDSFIVCVCQNRSKGDLMQLIRENDVHSLKDYRSLSFIRPRCGACGEDIEQLIEMVWEK